MTENLDQYLQPSYFIDFNHPLVADFAVENCDSTGDHREKATQLYYAVRDKIRYDPYDLQPERRTLKASSIVDKGSGYCVAKAVLLAAVSRQQSIPARLGFADVTNHLSTIKLREIMGTDIFMYHGYTEIFLDSQWVKATPAFNLSLCQRFNVTPLEFDGSQDSLFHEFDRLGHKHMEYLTDHGTFEDLPFERIFAAYQKKYPNMLQQFKSLKHNE